MPEVQLVGRTVSVFRIGLSVWSSQPKLSFDAKQTVIFGFILLEHKGPPHGGLVG